MRNSLRHIARRRLRASLAILDGPEPETQANIHELRKNIKKLRALLRLCRGGFDGFRREDSALRDAGRALSTLREGAVLLATFDSLGLPDPRLRARLAAAAHSPPADTAASLARHREILAGVLKRTRKWPPDRRGFAAIARGLALGWAEARDRMPAALDRPGGERLHEWRKRVKYHGYHAGLLAPIWPEMMSPHAQAADRLGDLLGQARDLALLIEAIELLGSTHAVDEARRLKSERLAEAGRIARRLFAEPAPHMVARWQEWWGVWRQDRRQDGH